MQRVSNGTQTGTLPTVSAVVGTPGYLTKGSPGVTPATIVDQDWANMLQEELVAVVLAGAVTMDKTNNAQLLQALRTMFRGQTETVFSAAGVTPWVAPANCYRVRYRAWAAGGGGGGVNGTAQSSGGGGGSYVEGVATVVPGTSYNVTVGQGGTGGAGTATPVNGTAGGSSSFSTFGTAGGGGGGYASGSGGQATTGAAGAASGGQVALNGTTGSGGNASTFGGAGGGSPFGVPGAPAGSNGGTGSAGGVPGGGGGGTATPTGGQQGGAGGNGLVILEY